MVAIDVRRDTAARLHAADPFADGPPGEPIVRVCVPTAPAIVLGSRQTPDLLDLDRVAAAGWDVVRRRSGGGAVLLVPDAIVWIDLIVPHGLAPDDVRGSMLWAGRRWRDALVALGAEPGTIELHEGGMVCTPWSGLVCFAGVGPGELLVGDRKLVGLSQRRTRHGLRIQGQVHRRSLLGLMPPVFAVETPSVPIGDVATLADVGLDGVEAAVL
ncbi:MAG: lipoate--protein ligase family protein, partial [Ilumatobacter sp.]|nr:lipoate--protein ligase family protein [Ilumatobacter sp.]